MSLKLTYEIAPHASSCRQFKVLFKWTPEVSYPAGSQIEIRFGNLRQMASWKLLGAKCADLDIDYRWKAYPEAPEYWFNTNYRILTATSPYGLKINREVTVELLLIPPIYSETHLDLNLLIYPKAQKPSEEKDPFHQIDTAKLPLGAGPVQRISVYSRPSASQKGVRTMVIPEDRYGNPSSFHQEVQAVATWFDGEKEIESQSFALKSKKEFYFPNIEKVGRCQVEISLADLSVSDNLVNGVPKEGARVIMGNPVIPQQSGEHPVFGEMHWHTEFSGDATRPLKDALISARDDLNMDWAIASDHTPVDAWQKSVEIHESLNEDDHFATMFGWEDSSFRGHQNYYFTDPQHTILPGGKIDMRGGGPLGNDEKLKPYQDIIVVPHHTNAVSETRDLETDIPMWFPFPWTEEQPTNRRLVEIMQVRGSQETEDYEDCWRGHHQNNGGSVREALDLGHKMGFTGGSDNHFGWPGRAYEMEEVKLGSGYTSKSVVLTGVWAPEKDRKQIFSGLFNRHTWAVWDTRSVVRFEVNGALMGSDLKVKKGENLKAKVKVWGEDTLQSLELISGGEVVWKQPVNELDFELEIDLGAAEKSGYVYLRGLQRNGGLFYASPVFFDC